MKAMTKNDARKAVRSKVDAKAWVRLDGGFSVRTCTVVDMSSTGVRVRCDAPRQIPDPFHLMMSRHSGGRRCRIVWREDTQLGAQFLES